MYRTLAREVFPLVEQRRESLDDSALEAYDELKDYYDEYMEKELEATQAAFAKVST